MSTKFDDPSYLNAWKTGGRYPDIHSAMTYAAGKFMSGGNLLDLCCSYGLLGARLKAFFPEKFPFVAGLDGDAKVVAASKEAGLPLDVLEYFRLVPDTQDTFLTFITHHAITAIVARRAFPELFSNEMGKGHDFGRRMARELHARGVAEILIEGRVYSPRSSNSLSRLEAEIALFEQYYRHEMVGPNIALLVAR